MLTTVPLDSWYDSSVLSSTLCARGCQSVSWTDEREGESTTSMSSLPTYMTLPFAMSLNWAVFTPSFSIRFFFSSRTCCEGRQTQ